MFERSGQELIEQRNSYENVMMATIDAQISEYTRKMQQDPTTSHYLILFMAGINLDILQSKNNRNGGIFSLIQEARGRVETLKDMYPDFLEADESWD